MRASLTFGIAALLLAGVSLAQAAELKSGLQQGESVGAFQVEKCGGAVNDNVKVGDQLCYRCMLGAKPVVMVFARKADDKLAGLVKELDKTVAKKVFDVFAPRYAARNGGYTRMIKIGKRQGDAADMVILELVDGSPA